MKYLPEGFSELIDFLSTIKANSVTAAEVQSTLSKKNGFSGGKVTGIIRRAEDRKLLKKIQRGIYSFDLNYDDTKNLDDDVLTLADKEIITAISNIEKIMGSRMLTMSTDEFQKMKEKVESLNRITRFKD